MYNKLKTLIDGALNISCVLEVPKDKNLGHFALPTFQFAKELKKAPNIIAQEFANKLQNLKEIDKLEVVGGYINFFVSDIFLENCIDNLDSKKEKKQQRILIEYVSANPTGPLHIGHARGAILGDSLCKIGKYLGYDIVSEYYVNDAGEQIVKLGKSICAFGKNEFYNEELVIPEGCYNGEYVRELAREAKEKFGIDCFKACDTDSKLLEQISIFGKDKMLQEIKDNLAKIGIYFDSYVSEVDMYKDWDSTLEILQKNNAIYKKDEKLWIKSTEYGDEKDRSLMRENGEMAYIVGDIIYHRNKFMRNFDRYINIWGADHHGYIARIKASLEFLGFSSDKLEIILSQMVALLKDKQAYKMSKRAGNFILMKDVIDDVGSDALRLVFLSKKADTQLEFDVEDLNKHDASNPVYYINYAHARIHTLFEKSNTSFENIEKQSLQNLSESLKNLLVLSLRLDKVLEDSFKDRAPNKVVEFLKNLSAEFHHFYNEEKILETQNEKQTLYALKIVANSIKNGLSLLGVNAKTKM